MKLHLGCGKRFLPGFVHIDQQSFPHLDYCHDVRSLPFLADGCASLLYACHVFEYFDRHEALIVLAEWRRLLRPGGVLRLAVPDFRVMSQLYNQGVPLSQILGPLYGRMEITDSHGNAGLIFHRTTYDFESLAALLQSCGFVAARQYDWRQSTPGGYDDFAQAYLPHLDRESGVLLSLNVEAMRQ